MGLFGKKNRQEDEQLEVMNNTENLSEEETSEVDNETLEVDNEISEESTDKEEKTKKKTGFLKQALESIVDLDSDNTEFNKDMSLSRIVDEIVTYLTSVNPMLLQQYDRGQMSKDSVVEKINDYIKLKKYDKIEEFTKDDIIQAVTRYLWSYDIIDELLADRDISDIKIYRYDHITIKRNGNREVTDLKFANAEDYLKFVEHIAVKNKISLSDQNAVQHFVDKESDENSILRFSIATKFVESSGVPRVHVRKIPKVKYTEEEFIKHKYATQEQFNYMRDRIKNEHGFLFVGRGGAGKTHGVNWLLDNIPFNMSVFVSQDNEELFSNVHPEIDFQHTVENRGEGKIEYDLGDLVKNALTSDMDVICIGEIKGDEAALLANAIYTGAIGIATVHGHSALEGMRKVVDYVVRATRYSVDDVYKMLIHLDTVVFMKDFHIAEIIEIKGYNEDKHELDFVKVY